MKLNDDRFFGSFVKCVNKRYLGCDSPIAIVWWWELTFSAQGSGSAAKANGETSRILLTCDRTLMSDYHHNEFLGFGTCAPPNFIPETLYSFLFFPPVKSRNGVPAAAPYGLRKIEAQLLGEGFDVLTISPQSIEDYVDEAKVLGIHVMDPFGLGPASSTLSAIFRKEPFLARHFRNLLETPGIKRAKRHGLRIVVGGQGAWQFQYRSKFVEKYGIDCVVEGEAEKIVGKIFRDALDGKELPEHYVASFDETPSLEEIPNIVNPSINGLIEIGRGCCRGCKFCSVTLRPLRWYSYEKIQQELDVNVKGEKSSYICLHGEDVMLYGSTNTLPSDEKLLKLHELAMKRCGGLVWSHCSLAAVACKPKLFSKVSEIVLQKQSFWGAEIGIETGSPRLVKKIMPAKTHPFKPEEWAEVVHTGMGLMHESKFVPACTLIVGAPEETEDDVIKTIELVDDLRHYRSLIVPLYFVPLGRLKDEKWFKDVETSELYTELLKRCLEHDLYWVDDLINMSFSGKAYRQVLQLFYRLFVRIARMKTRGLQAS